MIVLTLITLRLQPAQPNTLLQAEGKEDEPCSVQGTMAFRGRTGFFVELPWS